MVAGRAAVLPKSNSSHGSLGDGRTHSALLSSIFEEIRFCLIDGRDMVRGLLGVLAPSRRHSILGCQDVTLVSFYEIVSRGWHWTNGGKVSPWSAALNVNNFHTWSRISEWSTDCQPVYLLYRQSVYMYI